LQSEQRAGPGPEPAGPRAFFSRALFSALFRAVVFRRFSSLASSSAARFFKRVRRARWYSLYCAPREKQERES
jgi:hypothetical protein